MSGAAYQKSLTNQHVRGKADTHHAIAMRLEHVALTEEMRESLKARGFEITYEGRLVFLSWPKDRP